MEKINREKMNAQVYYVQPKIVYYANKVLITGYNFGWRENERIKLMSDCCGEVDPDFWTDSKIIFTIPLHWKKGLINLWIEKPVNWKDQKLLFRSRKVQINIISRFDPWDLEDDAYFEQFNHMDKETLKLLQ